VFNANNVAGSYTVRASVSGVATPASFALTNNAGPPAAITATSGMGQSTIVGSAFAQRLVATVRDAHANPVTGATVTFTVPGFGPSAVFAGGANTAVTNTAGQATSAVVSANNAIGTYNVAASVGGVAAAANFALTNTSIPIAALTIADGVVGQNLQVALSVTISEPAPLGGLNLVVTSANPSLVTVAGRPVDTGVASVTIPIGEGLKTATVFAHGLASSGSAQLTASAAGYPSDTATVTLAPSGFVLYGPNGVGVQSSSCLRVQPTSS
jgi:hypothetical protein